MYVEEDDVENERDDYETERTRGKVLECVGHGFT